MFTGERANESGTDENRASPDPGLALCPNALVLFVFLRLGGQVSLRLAWFVEVYACG